jgi:hypothetical protein
MTPDYTKIDAYTTSFNYVMEQLALYERARVNVAFEMNELGKRAESVRNTERLAEYVYVTKSMKTSVSALRDKAVAMSGLARPKVRKMASDLHVARVAIERKEQRAAMMRAIGQGGAA